MDSELSAALELVDRVIVEMDKNNTPLLKYISRSLQSI